MTDLARILPSTEPPNPNQPPSQEPHPALVSALAELLLADLLRNRTKKV